ncbi:MAG: hypothetical protein ABEK10_02505 [Candidatus Nanosalina sp.]
MGREPDNSEDLRPEEVLKGVGENTREIKDAEEVARFLKEWSEHEGFVEDLEHVADPVKTGSIRPEEVFQNLADSGKKYSIEEMLQKSEELSDREWQRYPEISGTGTIENPCVGDIVEVPRQKNFLPLSGSYIGEADFITEDKNIWVQEHSDGWFQTEVKPLTSDELVDFFESLERMNPAEYLHEVNFDGEIYYLDSSDLNYFFEFQGSYEEFEGEILRIESYFSDFVFEASVIPGGDEVVYRAMIFSEDGVRDPLEAYREIIDDPAVTGMKTRLELDQKIRGQLDATYQ